MPMKIKVHEVPEGGMQLSLAGQAITLHSKSLIINGPIDGKLSVQKQGDRDLYIRGSLSTCILLECGRCLSSFGHPVKSEFYVDCTPTVKGPIGQEYRLLGEDLNLHFYQGDTVDVDEIIESQIHLETPMVPLCQTDCKGLCLACGENLNEAPHVCIKG
jgi:uncharacterized protein